ncbi:hypothetical protein A9Q81_24310 [Gammaproteobacteria bacterium 42_54_T18]|nr:hypothetical protein A9Q81_24310 [Gammaproteobacteria bacterium 42_54_T18]
MLVITSLIALSDTSGPGYMFDTKELNELAMLTPPRLLEGKAAPYKAGGVQLEKGASILLIQSSAQYPEHALVSALSDYWEVSPLDATNKIFREQSDNGLVRNIARSGGNSHIVVCWVPMLGWGLPDKETDVKVQVKFAVIDVVSGRWRLVQPKPLITTYQSSIMTRKGQGKTEIEAIKEELYQAAVKALVQSVYTPEAAVTAM